MHFYERFSVFVNGTVAIFLGKVDLELYNIFSSTRNFLEDVTLFKMCYVWVAIDRVVLVY